MAILILAAELLYTTCCVSATFSCSRLQSCLYCAAVLVITSNLARTAATLRNEITGLLCGLFCDKGCSLNIKHSATCYTSQYCAVPIPLKFLTQPQKNVINCTSPLISLTLWHKNIGSSFSSVSRAIMSAAVHANISENYIFNVL